MTVLAGFYPNRKAPGNRTKPGSLGKKEYNKNKSKNARQRLTDKINLPEWSRGRGVYFFVSASVISASELVNVNCQAVLCPAAGLLSDLSSQLVQTCYNFFPRGFRT